VVIAVQDAAVVREARRSAQEQDGGILHFPPSYFTGLAGREPASRATIHLYAAGGGRIGVHGQRACEGLAKFARR
jgi:hypothetical protein